MAYTLGPMVQHTYKTLFICKVLQELLPSLIYKFIKWVIYFKKVTLFYFSKKGVPLF